MYNITTTNNKIQINCKDKKMEDDLVIEFNGEIVDVEEQPIGWTDVIDDFKSINDKRIKYRYLATNNKDLYFSSYNDKGKIYLFYANLETGEVKETVVTVTSSSSKISGFVEDSKGNVYASGAGDIILLNKGDIKVVGTGFEQLREIHETQNGNLYVLPSVNTFRNLLYFNGDVFEKLNTVNVNIGYGTKKLEINNKLYIGHDIMGNTQGLSLVDGKNVTTIISNNETSIELGNYFVKDNYLYVYFNNGIQCFSKEEPTNYATVFETTSSSWLNSSYRFISSEGDIYQWTSSSSNLGIIKFNGKNPVEKIIEEGYYFKFLEDKNKNVFFYSSKNSFEGIYKIVSNNATKVYDDGYNWYINYTSQTNGDLYLSSDNSSSLGVLRIKNGEINVILDKGYYYCYIEDTEGSIYLSTNGNRQNNGCYKVIGDNVYTVTEYMYSWNIFYEDSRGNKYIQSNYCSPIYEVSGETAFATSTSGYNYRTFYEDSKGDLYISNASNYDGDQNRVGIWYLNGKTKAYRLGSGSIMNSCQYFFEANGKTYASETELPEDGKMVYELTPTLATPYMYISKK